MAKGRGRAQRKREKRLSGRASSHPRGHGTNTRSARFSRQPQRQTSSGAPPAGSAWHAVSAGIGASSLVPLDVGGAEPAGPLMTLAGAEHGSLGAALHAWGVAQDAAANRIWRRPGGLTRLAGL